MHKKLLMPNVFFPRIWRLVVWKMDSNISKESVASVVRLSLLSWSWSHQRNCTVSASSAIRYNTVCWSDSTALTVQTAKRNEFPVAVGLLLSVFLPFISCFAFSKSFAFLNFLRALVPLPLLSCCYAWGNFTKNVHQLTPWNRVLLDKLITELLSILQLAYLHYLIFSQMNPFHILPVYLFKLHLILSFHLCLGLPRDLSFLRFLSMCFDFLRVLATYLAHCTLLDLNALVILEEEYKIRKFSFLHFPVASCYFLTLKSSCLLRSFAPRHLYTTRVKWGTPRIVWCHWTRTSADCIMWGCWIFKMKTSFSEMYFLSASLQGIMSKRRGFRFFHNISKSHY
jgi:hypothetical protein